jgi:hypothetical protein
MMPLSSSRPPPAARRSRAGLFCIVTMAPALCAIACGAPRAPEPKTSAEPPKAPYGAPPAEGAVQPSPQSAPADAAESAPAADMPSSAEREKSYADVDDIDALTRSLDRTLRLSVPDCGSAASLRDRICDLAQRICDIAARSAETEVAERCTDGKRRCERATASVRATCAD